MDKTYNGWNNRATWLINQYMSNDCGTYSWLNEIISTNLKEYKDKYYHLSDELISEIAEVLRVDITEMFHPKIKSDDTTEWIKEDLLGYALNEADWFELAKSHTLDWIEDNEIKADS